MSDMVASIFTNAGLYKLHSKPAMVTELQSTSIYPNMCIWCDEDWGEGGVSKKQVKRDNYLLLLFLIRKRRLKDQIKTASTGLLGIIKSEIQYYFTISQQMEGMTDGWMANLLSTISLPGEFSPLEAMVQIHQHQDEFFWILTSVLWVKRCDEKEPQEDLKTTASTNIKVPVGTTTHMNN